jgi:hypothetical protein
VNDISKSPDTALHSCCFNTNASSTRSQSQTPRQQLSTTDRLQPGSYNKWYHPHNVAKENTNNRYPKKKEKRDTPDKNIPPDNQGVLSIKKYI